MPDDAGELDLAAIEAAFPGLRGTDWIVTSGATDLYNCIAWAAGENGRWWWPSLAPAYWPSGVAADSTLAAFEELFTTLGLHRVMEAEKSTAGAGRIALYGIGASVRHAARELPDGRWTSKLGADIDITHDLAALEGDVYGKVLLILAKAD